MKVCGECQKLHMKFIEEERKKGIEIVECCFEECELGHPTFRPELPAGLKAMSGRLKEKAAYMEGPQWGWVYLHQSFGGVWYFWYRCSDLKQGHCSLERPDDSETCDIHYEPWMWVDDLKAWYGGLVNFGGCRPAENCGEDCGKVNSKRNGVCLQMYSEAPEVWDGGWLWCRYSNTGVTDCIFRTQYMVEDYLPLEKKPSWLERLRGFFRRP